MRDSDKELNVPRETPNTPTLRHCIGFASACTFILVAAWLVIALFVPRSLSEITPP